MEMHTDGTVERVCACVNKMCKLQLNNRGPRQRETGSNFVFGDTNSQHCNDSGLQRLRESRFLKLRQQAYCAGSSVQLMVAKHQIQVCIYTSVLTLNPVIWRVYKSRTTDSRAILLMSFTVEGKPWL